MRVTRTCWIAIGVCLAIVAAPAAAKKPPVGKTYYTMVMGLDEAFGLRDDCMEFEASGVCSLSGEICGVWQKTGSNGRQMGFSFEMSAFDDGDTVLLDGYGQLDSRGRRSSIGGVGQAVGGGRKLNFAFSGRETTRARCLALLDDAPVDGGTVVTGSGNFVTESREVGEFTAVVLSGVGELNIRQEAGSHSLSVTADDNVISIVTSEVIDGRLVLGIEEGFTFSGRAPVYDVTLGELQELAVNGVAAVDARRIDTESLDVRVNGVSVVEIAGTAVRQDVVVAGVSAYDARNLDSDEVDIDVSGVSSAIVRVRNRLSGTVSGAGVLEYIGTPTIDVTTTETGTVRPFGD